MSHTPFEIKLKGLPNEDIVRGFPGIGATWPRLEGTVEVRSKEATAMRISVITLALYRTDSIHPPTNKPGISAPKKDQSFLIGEKMLLFQSRPGHAYEEVIALDLPFLLTLPSNRPLPVSISLGKSVVETTYQLFISVVYEQKQQLTEHVSFPIRIKRYDTISTFGLFQVPITDSVTSPDHVVLFEYSIPRSCYGPTDTITAYIKVAGNPDWISKSKKVKIQRITMSIIEVVTFDPEGDEAMEKRRKVDKIVNTVDQKIGDTSYHCQLSLDFPQNDLRDKDNLIYKERPDIPLCARNGCSTQSALYKIDYLLVLKARLSHSKDIEVEIPITVTPFDHASCVSFMRSISDSVAYANSAAGKHATPNPGIYYANDPKSLWQFGKPGSAKAANILVS